MRNNVQVNCELPLFVDAVIAIECACVYVCEKEGATYVQFCVRFAFM